MAIYLSETEDCCDNCKTKVFQHLFEWEYKPHLARLLEPITPERAHSLFYRLGVPANTLDVVVKAALKTFPPCHADFIDMAQVVIAVEKVNKSISLLSAIRTLAEERGIEI
jgi:hypothetical protein